MISINIEVNHGCWRRKINAINYDVYHENIQILYASSGGKPRQWAVRTLFERIARHEPSLLNVKITKLAHIIERKIMDFLFCVHIICN